MEGGLSLDAAPDLPGQTWRKRDKEASRCSGSPEVGNMFVHGSGGVRRRESPKGRWVLVPLLTIEKLPSFLFREEMEIMHLTSH